MKLKKSQKLNIETAEEVLKEHGLNSETDYEFRHSLSGQMGETSEVTFNVTFAFKEEIVKDLIGLGWSISNKYKNNGSPSFFCSDLHNDIWKLQELIIQHGKSVQMVRMIKKA